jgi:hypothetical protein
MQPILDQVHCEFTPHVLLVRSGKPFLVRNSDPIMHNAHGFATSGMYSRFNVGIAPGGKDQEIVERHVGGIGIRCDAGHTWMQSIVFVAPNAFSIVTKDDGHFSIEGVPPGKYTLKLWHEFLKDLETPVEIAEGGNTQVFFSGDLFRKPMFEISRRSLEQFGNQRTLTKAEALIRSGFQPPHLPIDRPE